jgi:hypothetical protein
LAPETYVRYLEVMRLLDLVGELEAALTERLTMIDAIKIFLILDLIERELTEAGPAAKPGRAHVTAINESRKRDLLLCN